MLQAASVHRLDCPVLLCGLEVFMQFDHAILDAPWPVADLSRLRRLPGRAGAMLRLSC